jgi:methylated-DNA-[protein]-cysteine S-methyltransferase
MPPIDPTARRFIVASTPRRRPDAAGYAAVVAAPFAMVGIRIDADAVTAIDYLPWEQAALAPEVPLAREAVRQILAYAKDPAHAFDLPFAATGTVYQHRVWRAIVGIPRGTTRTYGELAASLGSSPRAVGGACGSNPIPLIVPCHRVLSADGRLGGFMHSRDTFALSIKRWLLEHEMR